MGMNPKMGMPVMMCAIHLACNFSAVSPVAAAALRHDSGSGQGDEW